MVATAVFASSYFFRRPLTLRRIQAGAAFLWVVYGMAIDAAPVVVANLIVAGAALYSSFTRSAPLTQALSLGVFGLLTVTTDAMPAVCRALPR